jgi:hypothetical protein
MYLTKPAGVFVQVLGGAALVLGLVSVLAGHMGAGTIVTLIGAGLMAIGRQTKKPDKVL